MAKKLSHKQRLEWKKRILKQRASDLSIAQWCYQNQVLPRSFYYWQSRLYPKAALTSSSFIEIGNNTDSVIAIEYYGVRISFDRYFDPEILKRCLLAIKELKC